MFKKLQALYAPENDRGTGGGAPDGGSDDDPGGDKDVVPRSQFIAAINSASRKSEALEATVNELKAKLEAATAEKREAPKKWTKAELKAAVAAEQITQDQADAQWEHQIREETRAEAQQTAHATVTAVERAKEVNAAIERYKAVAPEILDDSHETRQAIRTEYQALVKLGDDPKDVATQLKAIRAVLGPIERLEKARNGTTQHDTHRETGGGGGGGGGKKPTGKLFDRLSPENRAYYEAGIKQGRYKDVAAVEEELKYASPSVRARLGIAA